MILLRLLSAGKSLMGVSQKDRSFHLPEGQALPRFNAKKNPFRATALPEQPRRAAERPHVEESEPVRATPEPEVHPAPQASPPAAAKPVIKQKAETRSWIKGLKTFCVGKAAAPAKPGARVTQGELRLDTIQVVRNDLTESDIEIVPRREAAPIQEAATPEAIAGVAATRGSAWDKVSARIFGPNNVS